VAAPPVPCCPIFVFLPEETFEIFGVQSFLRQSDTGRLTVTVNELKTIFILGNN
jgi:hypothetical protein